MGDGRPGRQGLGHEEMCPHLPRRDPLKFEQWGHLSQIFILEGAGWPVRRRLGRSTAQSCSCRQPAGTSWSLRGGLWWQDPGQARAQDRSLTTDSNSGPVLELMRL